VYQVGVDSLTNHGALSTKHQVIKKNFQMYVEGGYRVSVDGNMPYFIGQIRKNHKEPLNSQKCRPISHIVPSLSGV
jgi:hypothetical protein